MSKLPQTTAINALLKQTYFDNVISKLPQAAVVDILLRKSHFDSEIKQLPRQGSIDSLLKQSHFDSEIKQLPQQKSINSLLKKSQFDTVMSQLVDLDDISRLPTTEDLNDYFKSLNILIKPFLDYLKELSFYINSIVESQDSMEEDIKSIDQRLQEVPTQDSYKKYRLAINIAIGKLMDQMEGLMRAETYHILSDQHQKIKTSNNLVMHELRQVETRVYDLQTEFFQRSWGRDVYMELRNISRTEKNLDNIEKRIEDRLRYIPQKVGGVKVFRRERESHTPASDSISPFESDNLASSTKNPNSQSSAAVTGDTLQPVTSNHVEPDEEEITLRSDIPLILAVLQIEVDVAESIYEVKNLVSIVLSTECAPQTHSSSDDGFTNPSQDGTPKNACQPEPEKEVSSTTPTGNTSIGKPTPEPSLNPRVQQSSPRTFAEAELERDAQSRQPKLLRLNSGERIGPEWNRQWKKIEIGKIGSQRGRSSTLDHSNIPSNLKFLIFSTHEYTRTHQNQSRQSA